MTLDLVSTTALSNGTSTIVLPYCDKGAKPSGTRILLCCRLVPDIHGVSFMLSTKKKLPGHRLVGLALAGAATMASAQSSEGTRWREPALRHR